MQTVRFVALVYCASGLRCRAFNVRKLRRTNLLILWKTHFVDDALHRKICAWILASAVRHSSTRACPLINVAVPYYVGQRNFWKLSPDFFDCLYECSDLSLFK